MGTPALFTLGFCVMTKGARSAFERNSQSPAEFLGRHISGDWGDLDQADKDENDFSLDKSFRIFSAYHLKDKTKIWIITEADRSATTILLPEEY